MTSSSVSHHGTVLGVALAIGLAGCAQIPQLPGDGRYDGELCVATGTEAPRCGAAEVSLSNGRAQVQVSDIVYDLLLEDGRLELKLLHGTMQVDAFNAAYAWSNRFLTFVDPDKPVHYRIRFANPAQ